MFMLRIMFILLYYSASGISSTTIDVNTSYSSPKDTKIVNKSVSSYVTPVLSPIVTPSLSTSYLSTGGAMLDSYSTYTDTSTSKSTGMKMKVLSPAVTSSLYTGNLSTGAATLDSYSTHTGTSTSKMTGIKMKTSKPSKLETTSVFSIDRMKKGKGTSVSISHFSTFQSSQSTTATSIAGSHVHVGMKTSTTYALKPTSSMTTKLLQTPTHSAGKSYCENGGIVVNLTDSFNKHKLGCVCQKKHYGDKCQYSTDEPIPHLFAYLTYGLGGSTALLLICILCMLCCRRRDLSRNLDYSKELDEFIISNKRASVIPDCNDVPNGLKL